MWLLTSPISRRLQDGLERAQPEARAPEVELPAIFGIIAPLIVVLLLQCCVIAISKPFNSEAISISVGIITTIVLAVAPMGVAIRFLCLYREACCRPIVIFLATSSMYFGLGSLPHALGWVRPDHSINLFPVTRMELLNVNLLNSFCILMVLSAYLVWKRLLYRRVKTCRVMDAGKPRAHLNALMYFLLVVGLLVKYLVTLPYELKLTNQVPAGLIVGLGLLTYGSHFYFWFQVGQGHRRWVLPLAFALADTGFGVLCLSKLSLLLPVVASILGRHLGKPIRFRTWLLVFLCGTVSLTVLQPFTTFLRLRRAQLGSYSQLDAIRDIADAVGREGLGAFQLMRADAISDDTFLSRLSYAGVQNYCIKAYGSGERGTSYQHVKNMLIPRWLWPEKPVVNPGLEFSMRVMGVDDTSTGLTLFGEAYYNHGVTGIVVFSCALALALALFEISMRLVLQEGRFEFSILLFLGVFLGLRVDDWAIMVASVLSYSVGLLVLLGLLERAFRYFKVGRVCA